MTLHDAFMQIIGPFGALFLLLVAVVYLWQDRGAQRKETQAMERDRDRWRDLYYLAVVSGERAAKAGAELANLPSAAPPTVPVESDS